MNPLPNIAVGGFKGMRTAIDMRRVVAIAEGPRIQRVYLENGPEPMPLEAPFDDLVQMWRSACFAR